jgi:GTPase SAR1 family protein
VRVVIRGERSTGKSCLFNRLQGKPFIEEYNQTPAIQISSIHWNYKGTLLFNNYFFCDPENHWSLPRISCNYIVEYYAH